MKFLIALAWKNLSRYRRRTLITASALAVGIAIFIWMESWLLGMEVESERNIIWYETGAAKIMRRDYWEEIDTLPLKRVIEAPQELEALLKKAGYPTLSRRTTFLGELFFGQGSSMVKLVGLEPGQDGQIFRLAETVAAGRYLKAREPGIVVGEWLAEDLGLEIGDEVVARTRTRFGSFQTLELEVVGILNSPNPMINKGTGFIPLSLVDERLQMEGSVTELVVDFPEWEEPEPETEKITRLLKDRFPELTVKSWQDFATDYLRVAEGKAGSTKILLFLIFIIAAVGISNTMLMAVFERIREIGMMRALGMKEGQIRFTFLLEAGGIGVIGSLAGLFLGTALTFWIVHWGVDFSRVMGDMDIGYRIHGVFRGAWYPEAMIGGVIFGVLASMIISFIPSSRALRKGIATCLREQ